MTMGGVEVDMREGSGIDLTKVDPLNVILKPRLLRSSTNAFEATSL